MIGATVTPVDGISVAVAYTDYAQNKINTVVKGTDKEGKAVSTPSYDEKEPLVDLLLSMLLLLPILGLG